ncbi:EAL domain-containing protein [Ferdinandcohnia sp. Marseille-Q9671]
MGENAGKINILIVDDRPENLLALEAIIESDEYQLIKAYSGEEALKSLLKYDFAAILLDVQMPGMDGFGTAKIIKARKKTKDIPILFITANNMDSEHIFMGYSVGAIDYITKPFNPMVLKAKVDGFVELYRMKRKLIEQSESLAQKNQEIEYMAFHDALTELPNRRMYNDQLIHHLHQAKQRNKSLGILHINIDRFKYINDSLGHTIGDKLLQKIGRKISSSVRQGDLVSRLGGDEFGIILPETDREKALEIAENLLDIFALPILIDNYNLFITTCIGLSVFPFDGEDSTTLLKNADTALYRAKEQGKNKFNVYHSGMNIRSYRSFLMQNDLRHAIQKEELSLVYQPRVNVETGHTSSVEALLRWNHASWGAISPSEFIPLAEETGQIVEIGKWVLKTACNQISQWKALGLPPVRVAINFSPQQFLQVDLLQYIESALTETNVSPNQLEIEITESIFLGNEEAVTQTLYKLRKMGIHISLDDFGTGYSSLNYLRLYPVDTIKIDKSFIQDISKDLLDSKAIIKSIAELGANLRMSVIAEGVETQEQLDFVQSIKCQEVQGYIFSRPIPASELETFLLSSIDENDSAIHEPNQLIQQKHAEVSKLEQRQEKDLRKEILDTAMIRLKNDYAISSREMDVFKLIVLGLSNKDISEELFISEHTVKNHITKILHKLNVTDRVQAIALVYDTCIQEGETLALQ